MNYLDELMWTRKWTRHFKNCINTVLGTKWSSVRFPSAAYF